MVSVEDKNNMNNIAQNLILENKEKLTITGTRDVLSFDDQLVIVDTQKRYVNNKRRKFKSK